MPKLPKLWYYSVIIFNERVPFWLQCVLSLPCVRMHVTLFARRLAYNKGLCNSTHIQCSKCACTRQWPGTLKPKSYSLIEGNRNIENLQFTCYDNGNLIQEDIGSFCALSTHQYDFQWIPCIGVCVARWHCKLQTVCS